MPGRSSARPCHTRAVLGSALQFDRARELRACHRLLRRFESGTPPGGIEVEEMEEVFKMEKMRTPYAQKYETEATKKKKLS